MSFCSTAVAFRAPDPGVPVVLNNQPYGSRGGDPFSPRRPDLQAPQVRPPGGALVAMMLAAASGAAMGFAIAGYLTIAATAFFVLPLGIAIGLWMGDSGQ